jgi:hypothetical protein
VKEGRQTGGHELRQVQQATFQARIFQKRPLDGYANEATKGEVTLKPELAAGS